MKTTLFTFILFIAYFAVSAQQNSHEHQSNNQKDPEEAVETLLAGNQRFLEGASIHPHETRKWISTLKEGQKPFAVIIGCSDSRVPPELVFDQGFGDIFVIRIAGNVIDTDVLASVEYATEHLQTKLVLVMGHTECGAVKATISHLNDPEGEPSEIVSLLYQIEPALIGMENVGDSYAETTKVVQRNVELGVRKLSRAPAIRKLINAEEVAIKGAIYDISTGKVKILE